MIYSINNKCIVILNNEVSDPFFLNFSYKHGCLLVKCFLSPVWEPSSFSHLNHLLGALLPEALLFHISLSPTCPQPCLVCLVHLQIIFHDCCCYIDFSILNIITGHIFHFFFFFSLFSMARGIFSDKRKRLYAKNDL